MTNPKTNPKKDFLRIFPLGGVGEIGVVYKPGKQKNNQSKKVTITANTDPVQTILTIKANVLVPNS